ncbi:nuclear transport factor 2 family protein [Methanocalculus sp.]|nr:nuclear transport factor 2 family protein [Methanocalculus sp.]MDO8842270.1 nuclear transport factor 2 family protein [Methanocalculus sp.]
MLSKQTEEQIRELLDRYLSLYGKKDLDTILSLFSEDCMGIGTGKDEIIRNRDELKEQLLRDFTQVNELAISMDTCIIRAEGTICWVMGDLTFTADGTIIPCRCTMVLRGTGHRWEIVQMHISVPAHDQAGGRSYSD